MHPSYKFGILFIGSLAMKSSVCQDHLFHISFLREPVVAVHIFNCSALCIPNTLIFFSQQYLLFLYFYLIYSVQRWLVVPKIFSKFSYKSTFQMPPTFSSCSRFLDSAFHPHQVIALYVSCSAQAIIFCTSIYHTFHFV